MSKISVRLAILAATTPLLGVILLHCSGNGSSTGEHTTLAEAGPSDGGVPDGAVPDGAAPDGAAPDASGVDESAADASATDAGFVDESATAADDSGDAASFVGIPCDVDAEASACSGTMSCCGGWCTDTSHDPRNCGACGNACSSSQFCSGVDCQDAVFKNLCRNPAATVVFDPYTDDNEAGVRMATALATGCMPQVSVTVAPDAGVGVDPGSGRPNTGPGNTLVAGGGSYGQPSVGYIDDKGLSTVRLQADGTNTWFQNFKTGADVGRRVSNSELTAHHDFFLLELNTEPVSGTLCFFGIGFLNAGTAAAGYYFQNRVMPSLSTFTDAWYVYEWTDTDADSTPSAGDTFKLVGNGM